MVIHIDQWIAGEEFFQRPFSFSCLLTLTYIYPLGWQCHWSVHQRLDFRENGIQEDYAGLVDFDDLIHFYPPFLHRTWAIT